MDWIAFALFRLAMFGCSTGIHTLRQVRAVVVRLDAATRILGVDVECVQVRADLLDRREVLHHAGASLEDAALCCPGVAGDSAELGAGAFCAGCHVDVDCCLSVDC